MRGNYILKGHTSVPEPDIAKWEQWFEKSQKSGSRVVARDEIGDVTISTVFLGIDHNWLGGTPLLFETMIFGGEHDQYQNRCSTWAEAEGMHREAVELVKGGKS